MKQDKNSKSNDHDVTNTNELEEKELREMQELRTHHKSQMREINQNDQLEKSMPDENKTPERDNSTQKDIEKFVYDTLCDDCKKEKDDPNYQNPNYYTNNMFDMEKYNDHALEELNTLIALRQDRENTQEADNEIEDVEDDQDVNVSERSIGNNWDLDR